MAATSGIWVRELLFLVAIFVLLRMRGKKRIRCVLLVTTERCLVERRRPKNERRDFLEYLVLLLLGKSTMAGTAPCGWYPVCCVAAISNCEMRSAIVGRCKGGAGGTRDLSVEVDLMGDVDGMVLEDDCDDCFCVCFDSLDVLCG